MRATSLLSALMLALCFKTTAAQSYSITGTVVDNSGGSPIPHSHLSASLSNHSGNGRRSPSPETAVDADDRGHFMLPLPAPGMWNLFAAARDFRSRELDEHEGFSTGVVLSPSTPSVDVVFELTRNSSIAGYVLDEAGEPVRNAQTRLSLESPKLADQLQSRWQGRGATSTDDRGHYEFAGLAPGRYQVMVQAQPWYAVGTPRLNEAAQQDSATASPLDMAYPLTWYPGVTDVAQAGILTLSGGDNAQADMRLQPVPSIHLRIPPAPGAEGNRRFSIPQIQLLTPNGAAGFQPVRSIFNTQGGVDIGGLAPGTYELATVGEERARSILHVSPGSPRTLDLSAAQPYASVSVVFDMPEGTSPPQVRFVDADTGRDAGSRQQNINIRASQVMSEGSAIDRRARPLETAGSAGLRSRGPLMVELAPGRYQVTLSGGQGQYLTGLTATGAETSGRFVTIHGLSAVLTVHLATGRATLTGTATFKGKSSTGAMILLVPATLGDPQSLAIVRRDQTNTDGSFDLRDIIPGRYILVAIDHGWRVNWSDAATLRPYLIHGVPVDLSGAGTHRETIEAQTP